MIAPARFSYVGLVNEFHGQASYIVEATPQAVFDLLIDLDRLADWNAAIEALVEGPRELTEGAEWTVKMHPRRMPSLLSISRVELLDVPQLRFAYETRNADGNASRVIWSWSVEANGDGAEVTVAWDCHVESVDRKFFSGPMRKRRLAREVPNSLTALCRAAARTSSIH